MAEYPRLRWVPNAICILRIILVPVIVQHLLAGAYPEALGLILLAGLSDGLDGFLAKRFDWQTRLGGLLDPAADKFLLVSVFLTLAWQGLVPPLLAALVVGRDVVIVAGATAYHYLIAPVQAMPSRVSKINTTLQLLFALCLIANLAFGLGFDVLVLMLGAGVFVMAVVSGLDYVLRWSLLARQGRAAGS